MTLVLKPRPFVCVSVGRTASIRASSSAPGPTCPQGNFTIDSPQIDPEPGARDKLDPGSQLWERSLCCPPAEACPEYGVVPGSQTRPNGTQRRSPLPVEALASVTNSDTTADVHLLLTGVVGRGTVVQVSAGGAGWSTPPPPNKCSTPPGKIAILTVEMSYVRTAVSARHVAVPGARRHRHQAITHVTTGGETGTLPG
ncbi:hypothetical protein Bbelb_256400 [Branchiostoma belcheri]|nr:hypothetical protein Bbelb_256400 [Branchiostoma belcheri]